MRQTVNERKKSRGTERRGWISGKKEPQVQESAAQNVTSSEQ